MKIILFLIFTTSQIVVWAQQKEAPPQLTYKRFIDKVEVIVGPSLHFPNDNGWSERIYKESQGLTSNEFKQKVGFVVGFGATHQLGKRFEINGRVAWDRKGYQQETVTLADNNNAYKYEANTRNDYITGTIAPVFFIDKRDRFFISSGIFYSHLLKSFIKETSYLNNQVLQHSSITNSPEISKYDAGVLFVIGYSLSVSNKNKLSLQLQGNYGLTDTVNVNGLVININSLSLLIILKHSR